ncbi:MAG: L-serine ammonia-lyase, iron-sulfur-dependent, subunit alpha [Anaerolineae bacterium]|nr:L-serine ammonia-lyase, iron-sulfur-dependent, subunit alpha [Anaerolineae bacterium]
MRGPSSSHCAAALRIGRMARDLMDGDMHRVLVEFDPRGALATTHESHGSDMGLFGGLLGWEAWDERLPGSAQAIREAGVRVTFRIAKLDTQHPNCYQLTLENAVEQHRMVAISSGGGMIEIAAIDGFRVSMLGDYYETLLYLDAGGEQVVEDLNGLGDVDSILMHQDTRTQLIEVKGQRFLPQHIVSQIRSTHHIRGIKMLAPVLLVLSRQDLGVPFLSCAEMLSYNAAKSLDLWKLAICYESARGNLTSDQVLAKMRDLVGIMRRAVRQGIAGTDYADRMLGVQSGAYKVQMEDGRLLDGGILNRIILYVTALMEVKSAMGVIVAAPTAGACGALPGACIGAAEAMGLSIGEMTRAMLAAGLIGVFIAARATFSAEVAGCQAECGAGSAMAAAALVTLAKGTVEQAVDAASMALQNVLGLICDPVANRVEVPCLGRNVMAASNALACANMALAGFDSVIPLDQVIETMIDVGQCLPRDLRCTALGGLSVTKMSREIEKQLDKKSKETRGCCF